MKKTKDILTRVILGTILICIAPIMVNAQQDPMFTQYMFNTQTINPAYAGSWRSVGFMALARNQWIGVSEAPSTQTFSFQMPLNNEKVGIGLNIINDKIGLEQRFSVFADYAYKISFKNATALRMGIKAGFSNYSHNLSEHILYDNTPDPAFNDDIGVSFMPNVGVGFLLENPSYYVGVSMPKLINTPMGEKGNNFAVQGEFKHFFLIAGYVFKINNDIKLKPTILAKAITGTPVQFDLTANVILKDKFSLGTMYRTGDSFGFIAQWIFDNKLRVGYAIDFSTSNLRNYHYGSHEIMISYELKFLDKDVVSPRYF